jgi:hypothetical protein
MNKDQILMRLSNSDKTEFGKDNFATQSLPQKVFSSLWALESEVNNGGFQQYFYNDSAETVPFIADALELIGAARTAQICRQAILAAFPAGPPSTPEAVSSAAADFDDETLEKLDKLDREFFAYPDNLTDLLYAFVAEHPDEFGPIAQAD